MENKIVAQDRAGIMVQNGAGIVVQGEAKTALQNKTENTLQQEEHKEFELCFTSKKDIKLLSKRQLECLSLCAHGLSNSRISKVLFISESTVKKTLEETFRKLSAKCRTNAVTLGFVFGILNTEILNKIAMQYEIKMQDRKEWE